MRISSQCQRWPDPHQPATHRCDDDARHSDQYREPDPAPCHDVSGIQRPVSAMLIARVGGHHEEEREPDRAYCGECGERTHRIEVSVMSTTDVAASEGIRVLRLTSTMAQRIRTRGISAAMRSISAV